MDKRTIGSAKHDVAKRLGEEMNVNLSKTKRIIVYGAKSNNISEIIKYSDEMYLLTTGKSTWSYSYKTIKFLLSLPSVTILEKE